MSPETKNLVKWRRQNQEEGINMQVEKPPVRKGVHNVHTPFANTAQSDAWLTGDPTALASVVGPLLPEVHASFPYECDSMVPVCAVNKRLTPCCS
jgi:hypothetical protein